MKKSLVGFFIHHLHNCQKMYLLFHLMAERHKVKGKRTDPKRSYICWFTLANTNNNKNCARLKEGLTTQSRSPPALISICCFPKYAFVGNWELRLNSRHLNVRVGPSKQCLNHGIKSLSSSFQHSK